MSEAITMLVNKNRHLAAWRLQDRLAFRKRRERYRRMSTIETTGAASQNERPRGRSGLAE
eukprot:11705861-Alexandrium_andersonii.AAC.1